MKSLKMTYLSFLLRKTFVTVSVKTLNLKCDTTNEKSSKHNFVTAIITSS